MVRTSHGFSLIETVMVLAVAMVLFAVGAGPIADMVHGIRLQVFTSELLHQLMLARSKAIVGYLPVTLCKSADGLTCSGDRWDQGWIVFQDRNRSGTREVDEPVLQQVQALPAGWRILANAPIARYVSYGPMGTTQHASGAFQAGTFTVCRASLERTEGRQLVINAGGRPRVQQVWLNGCF